MRKIWFFLALTHAVTAFGLDKLVIISPHRKSVQDEFIPRFKQYYRATFKAPVDVEWIDQGGTTDDVRFIRAKYAQNSKTSGIDIFWGGGTSTFIDLSSDKYLDKYELPKGVQELVPEAIAGTPTYDKSQTWYAAALSSFGIFINRPLLKLEGMVEPTRWDDLGQPKMLNLVSVTDPRRSGTASSMNAIVVESMGWDKGWEMMTRIAGNTKAFTHSSSDPIKAVVSGDVAAAMAIDYYALAKIADLGEKNVGFLLPAGQTILDSDPIGILRGAPNRKVAERFVDYVLGTEAQKLLLLPMGQKDGPSLSVLARMSANPIAYKETEGRRVGGVNPFAMPAVLKVDYNKMGRQKPVLDDLVGALLVDTHKELKEAWEVVIRNGARPEQIAALGKMPVTAAEFDKLADKWSNEVVRNKHINEWVAFARKKYSALKSGATPTL